jgi:hypothetical protein
MYLFGGIERGGGVGTLKYMESNHVASFFFSQLLRIL